MVHSHDNVLRLVNEAERVVLTAKERCTEHREEDIRVAESLLGMARRGLVLKDWGIARTYAREAIKYAERAIQGTKGTSPKPDQDDPE